MFCGYRSDFLEMGGYDDSIKGWGQEDVDLYERMVRQAKYNVHRAIEPGLIQKWHPKKCDKGLPKDQYRHCRKSAMDYEGDKHELGGLLVSCLENATA